MDTDAEGRLTLADALVFAEQLGVEAVVDIATCALKTCGICVFSLGLLSTTDCKQTSDKPRPLLAPAHLDMPGDAVQPECLTACCPPGMQ
jgi:Cytosol aminopeptidase family, catalytic domain